MIFCSVLPFCSALPIQYTLILTPSTIQLCPFRLLATIHQRNRLTDTRLHAAGVAKPLLRSARNDWLLTDGFCYRAMLCMGLCLCPCPSVTSRSSTKTAKRRITQTTPRYLRDSSFLIPKISAKFDRGHPLRGRRMQVGWVKIGDFRQISGYISKTVKDKTHSFY